MLIHYLHIYVCMNIVYAQFVICGKYSLLVIIMNIFVKFVIKYIS